MKIRRVVDSYCWNHIAGVCNPADVPTRVCSSHDFKTWLKGAKFMYDEDFEVQKFDVEKKLNMVDVVIESRRGERNKRSIVGLILGRHEVDVGCDVGSRIKNGKNSGLFWS